MIFHLAQTFVRSFVYHCIGFVQFCKSWRQRTKTVSEWVRNVYIKSHIRHIFMMGVSFMAFSRRWSCSINVDLVVDIITMQRGRGGGPALPSTSFSGFVIALKVGQIKRGTSQPTYTIPCTCSCNGTFLLPHSGISAKEKPIDIKCPHS